MISEYELFTRLDRIEYKLDQILLKEQQTPEFLKEEDENEQPKIRKRPIEQ